MREDVRINTLSRSRSSNTEPNRPTKTRHMASPLDATDHQILDALVSDGRMSMRTLAETLHISRANAYARVERLRTSGVIRGFRAEVDPELSGLGTSAYVTLNVRQEAWRQIA